MEKPDNSSNGFKTIESQELSEGKAIISQSVSHKVENYCLYNFNAVNSAKYYFWFRMYGENACGNSFYMSVDNSNRFVVGNDALMKKWHWLKAGAFDLNKGKHTLYVWNEEARTGVDVALITSDNNIIPTGKVNYSDYRVTFDGKYDEYTSILGTYNIEKSKQGNLSALNFKPSDKAFGYFIFNQHLGHGQILKTNFDLSTKDTFKLYIVYNFLNEADYDYIELLDFKAYFYSKKKENIELFDSVLFNIPLLLYPKNNQMAFIQEDSIQGIYLNGLKLLEIANKEQLGIGSADNNIYFTEISKQSDNTPDFNCNFFDGLDANWDIVSGEWKTKGDPYYELYSTSKASAITFGSLYWENYTYSANIKTTNNPDPFQAGMFFYYLDDKNHFKLCWNFEKENHQSLEIIKVKNGASDILFNIPVNIKPNQFTRFSISIEDSLLNVYHNGLEIFSTSNSELTNGKAGLFKYGNNSNVYFDDVTSSPATKRIDSINTFEYFFNNRLNISQELTDWGNLNSILAQDHVNLFKTKGLFEKAKIYNRLIFTGNTELLIYLSQLPNDVDFKIEFKDIESNEPFISILFKHNMIVFNNNNKLQVFELKGERSGDIVLSLNKENKKFQLKFNGEIYYEDSITGKLGDYRLSIGYEGIGKFRIYFPYVRIKTNSYYIK